MEHHKLGPSIIYDFFTLMINKRMLHLITSLQDKLLSFVKDDPVRPEISPEFRVQDNRFIATLLVDEHPTAMVCISLHDFVPQTVEDLAKTSQEPTTCVFYTIWSYQAGSGAELLKRVLPELKAKYPTLTTFVTLSPKTELAKRFHLSKLFVY
jgi:hypothetical protein